MKIKKGQRKLTASQMAFLKRYAQKKIKRYLTPKQWESDEQIKLYVNNAYKVAGLALPERIIFFDSPERFVKYTASVWASVGDSVGDSVWASVRDSVWASVGDSVGDSVWDSVGDSVWDSVGDSVGASVWASVGASVRDSVWASVRDSVGDSVRDSVGAWWYADDLSFFKVFNDHLEPNNLVWLQLLSENVTGFALYEKEVWLVRKPIRLTRDDRGRLHNEGEKAIEWKDGFGFYYLYGVRFNEDKELFESIVNRKLMLKDCMEIENMEQRMIALKYLGVEHLLKDAVLEDNARGYELYRIDNVFPTSQYFLRYQCPSTGREYLSGIDPEIGRQKSAVRALEWKFYLDEDETFLAES